MPRCISSGSRHSAPCRPARPTSCRMDADLSARLAPNRTMRKSRSWPAESEFFRDRYASRVILFSRFRRTAPPHPRATTTPKRFPRLPLLLYRSLTPRPSILEAEENSSRMSLLLRSRSFLVRLLLIRGREFHPPLGAPSLQNKPPTLCRHARAKAELPRPLGLAGLIGPFHGKMLLAYPDEQ